jgi:hypothetical protein
LPAAAPVRTRSLFVNNERRWPARVPAAAGPLRSDSYSDASTLHYTSSLSGCGFKPKPTCWGNSCPASDAWGFVYNASDPRSPRGDWADTRGMDVLVFGSWTASWSPVAAIVPANSTLLTTSPLQTVPGAFGGEGCPAGAR